MKLDKLLLALLVISVVLFAVPASVYADDDNSSSGSGDDEEDEIEDESQDENENELEDESEIEDESGDDSSDDDNSSSDENETENESEFEDESESEIEDEYEDELESESESEIDDDDGLEVDDDVVSSAKYNHGMEVRLLQLQKSIVNHVAIGKIIVDEIDNQNFSVDTTNLENYLGQFKDLNEKITDELANDPVTVTTEEFVAMKHEATKTTYQFKGELYTILTPEQLKIVKDAIKDKVKIKSSDELKVEEKFRAKVKEYNQEVALKMLEKFGGDNKELREKISASELDAKELKENLREEYKNLGEARKNQLKIKIQEEKRDIGEEKLELEAKIRGLNRSEVAKIASDNSLTLEEKQAKIRVLMEEQKTLNPAGRANGLADSRINASCQNYPPPNFCDATAARSRGKIVDLGKDEQGCTIWGCKN
ncbi:MAG: hypothetical protein ACP5N2_00955 [Candidatus Nanoarchaeia archaeon]